MKNMTEAQIFQMLKDAAIRHYGEKHSRELSAALQETAKGILKTRGCDLALEDEPSLFSR